VLEPTVAEQAARQAADRNLDPGTSPDSQPLPSSYLPSPPSVSGFLILDTVPMDYFDIVASDCSIIFRGSENHIWSKLP
jgi:hypothetical protein